MSEIDVVYQDNISANVVLQKVDEVEVVTPTIAPLDVVTVPVEYSVDVVRGDEALTDAVVTPPTEVDLITNTGLPGKSAYELALDAGFEGTLEEWLESLVGPSGTPADDLGFVHVQGTPSSEWTIRHELPFTPNVTVVDSTGSEVVGDIHYTSDSVVISFSGAFSGTAYLS